MRGWRNWQTRMIQVTYPKCKGLKSAKANDKIVMKIALKKLICGYGETGKHVWFRSICRETCRFKSCYPHHRSKPYVSRLWAFFISKEKAITTKKQVHNIKLCICHFSFTWILSQYRNDNKHHSIYLLRALS